MFLNILLSFVLFGSLLGVWIVVGRRIPALLMVPENLILAHLEEDSSRIRRFLLEFKSFFRERRYEIYLLRFAAKILIRIRFAILKTDNFTASLLRQIKIKLGNANGISYNNGNSSENDFTKGNGIKMVSDIYWDVLKDKGDDSKNNNSDSSSSI